MANNDSRLNSARLTTITSASALLILLVFTIWTGNKAFAMGPASCYPEYYGTYTSFTITNGTQTIDILHSATPLNVDVSKTYTLTYTLHATNSGTTGSGTQTYTNTTQLGNVWETTNLPADFSEAMCISNFTINSDKTETLTVDYASIHNSLGPLVNPPYTQNVSWNTRVASAAYTINWINKTSTTIATAPQLTVNSQDSSGSVINGYYTILMQNGATVKTGFTPATFTLNNNQQYSVEVQDYGQYVFDHWKDNGSTSRDRTVSITANAQITAIYRNVNSPPPSSSSSIFVKSVDSSNNPLTGYYTVLYQNNAVVNSGFTPATFATTLQQTYTIEVQDYGAYHFNHWSDGLTTRDRAVIGTSSAQTFTAVYSTTASSPPTGSGSSRVSIQTVDQNGNNIFGYYASLWQNGNQIDSCYSTCAFGVSDGQAYQIAVADYGSCTFSHWENGSTDKFATFESATPTSVILRATYNCA